LEENNLKIDIQDHMLVPKHEIMTEEEIANEFSDVDYDFKDLPKIKVNDPVAKSIGAEPGNVLRITRQSQTAGVFVTYRIVEL
jgi:DNA-directed RNA polymerase subunit H